MIRWNFLKLNSIFFFIWKYLNFVPHYFLKTSTRKLTDIAIMSFSCVLQITENQMRELFYILVPQIINDSTLTSEQKLQKISWLYNQIENMIGCVRCVLQNENVIKVAASQESEYFGLSGFLVFMLCILGIGVSIVCLQIKTKTMCNVGVIVQPIYLWNGSFYKYQIVLEIKQKISLSCVNFGWMNLYNVFFFLSGTKANEQKEIKNPFLNTTFKARGVWHFPDDLTFHEQAVIIRALKMAQSRAERQGKRYLSDSEKISLYMEWLNSLAKRIEAQPFYVREQQMNEEYIKAWELLRNDKLASSEEINYWLTAMSNKIDLMAFQQMAYQGAIKAEILNHTAGNQPKLFPTAEKMFQAQRENHDEILRLARSRKYLNDMFHLVNDTDPSELKLDLGFIFVYVFGDYTEEEAIDVSIQARAAAEKAVPALRQMMQHEITAFRQDLPVWSTVIGEHDIEQKLIEFASEPFPDTVEYLTNPHWRWKTWQPQVWDDVEVQGFSHVMVEMCSSLSENHTIPEYVLATAALAAIIARGGWDEPVLMKPLTVLPEGLKEMPVIYGSRGAHVVTQSELQKIYEKQKTESLEYAINTTAAPDISSDSFSWGPVLFGVCTLGIIYYYRNEIWTFLDETATSFITNKSKIQIRYERTQELLRRKETLLKQQERAKWERFRDETMLNYAPQERDLRTTAEVKKEFFIQGLWNDWKTFTDLIDPVVFWFLENGVTVKLIWWYVSAFYLYMYLLKKLFPFERRVRQWLFWRSFRMSKFYGYGKRNAEEEEVPVIESWFMQKWPKIKTIKINIILFIRTIYYNIMYCSRLDFFLILCLIILSAWSICWLFADWRFYFPNPERAAGEYYVIDDTTWKWSRTKTFPLYETQAGEIYKYDLLFARYLEPQYMLYPDGTDTFFTTRGIRVPDLPLESRCWSRFWAAQLTYGRCDWVYREDLPLLTNDRWNDYWVGWHYRGIYRYAPYNIEQYNAILHPTMIQGELKTYLWVPLAILNIALMWWNFWNPRLGHWEDLDNPDNLISGPDRVYMNETQKAIIEAEEKRIYAERMDEQILVWRAKNISEDDPATTQFLLEQSAKIWAETRREVSEKHWLPYTRNVDRDGMPRSFNSKERGNDRQYVWQQIEADRRNYQIACYEARCEQWKPYEDLLNKIYEEKNIFSYLWSRILLTRQFNKTLILPIYRSKWEELVLDDPHPDDEVYGSGG